MNSTRSGNSILMGCGQDDERMNGRDTRMREVTTYKNYIAGEWRESSGGQFEVKSPGDGDRKSVV